MTAPNGCLAGRMIMFSVPLTLTMRTRIPQVLIADQSAMRQIWHEKRSQARPSRGHHRRVAVLDLPRGCARVSAGSVIDERYGQLTWRTMFWLP
jgi:hypothetical protein